MRTTTRTGTRRGRHLPVVAAATMAMTMAVPAFAVTVTMGNEPVDRALVDSFVNFTIVDTNHPAAFDGYFTEIDYFAERAGDVRFVVVNTDDVVTWVSGVVSATGAGPGTHLPGEPVGVTAGSNLGVYSVGAGVVSYDISGDASAALWEASNAGLPVVGETLAYRPGNASSPRFYSMSADVHAASPQICKDGGWEAYGYRNQGQCIASVVANPNSGH